MPPTVVQERTVHALGPGGVIRDWLVSPAWRSPCDDLAGFLDADGEPWGENGRWTLSQGPEVAPLKERLYRRRPLVLDQPRPALEEGGPVSWVAPGRTRTDHGTWLRAHTHDDGLVDWSTFCPRPEYQHAVAGTVLEVDQPEWRTIEVASTGPVAVWLGSSLLEIYTDISYMEPVCHTVRARIGSGLTPLLIATWQAGFRETRHVARIAVGGLPVRVVIPSPGADEHASAIAERVLDSVALDSWAAPTRLTGPAGAAVTVTRPGAPPRRLVLPAALDLSGAVPGETALTLRAGGSPVSRVITTCVLPPRTRERPDGGDGRREVLEHVTGSAPGVARALAAASTGRPWGDDDLAPALGLLRDRADCADFEAAGLLALWHEAPRDDIKAALLGFKYWIDQPGLDAMCYFTENHQIVFHTAETLAGQAFRDETFTNTGWPGARHAAHGRAMAMEWIRAKLAGGFSEFDSNAYVAVDSLALVLLAEHADPGLAGAAEALLDKLLFTLAANSWHGIHGAAHGRSYARTLRSSRFEETAPVMWALWGAGTLNDAVLPATCLARASRYRVPALVGSVATDFDAPWYGRQVYRGQYTFERDLLSRPYGSDLRVWKTAHAMLSSVQDYRPGLPGLQEHVWGATLAPEAQVFATYPGAGTDSPCARPNAWAGQRVLPRARQDRDTVLVAYPFARTLPTHAWFPAPFMDQTAARGSWLAGRVGRGYVAIACAGGLAPVTAGGTAGQEWRPAGDGTAFAATVGCAEQDGSFEEFVRALAEPVFSAGAVAWTARDGRRLALDGTSAFTVDGAAPESVVHLENPACRMPFGADLLSATHRGHHMTLDITRARRVPGDL